jgi:prevent-host-death family protein
MDLRKVGIGEGKKEFTRIVKGVAEKENDVVITRRGEPVAVLIPYGEYKETVRLRSYLKMLRISEALKSYEITAVQIQKENRKELENGHGRG